jgi:maltooligosyltrehalose trehalohydrolase
MTSFVHAMPFGAEVADGSTRFRLWAPSGDRIGLVVDGREIDMPAVGEGWFEVTDRHAGAGSRYQFRVEGDLLVPDPASRFQPDDVHGASAVVDPAAYRWRTAGWRGRPFAETVLYELHVGCFSEEGSFDGLRRRLDELAKLGVTAVELMPLSEFSGRHNWGYDGVLPFAPDSAYGHPDDLKRLIDEAHERELMVWLDVVYNHFGPEGNYLHVYAGQFFDEEEHTPWGGAINYEARPVRDFAINNVLYWLEEYRFDGLRFDAVDWILDDSETHVLEEIAATVRERITDRHVHLVLENDNNDPHLLQRREDGRPRFYDAQWNDDIHHVYQHLLTGDAGGYYVDYSHYAHERLARALASGFVYQGEQSNYRGGKHRGQPSGDLPPTAFVSFLQNHDQVGNRAFGERIADLAEFDAVQSMQAVQLLAPNIPLLFMGEEWGAVQPFCFFTDFHDELADAVREGRRREFQKFPEFASEDARAHIPDPNLESTFLASRLDRSVLDDPVHQGWLEHTGELLALRQREVVPRLTGIGGGAGEGSAEASVVRVAWQLGDGSRLALLANLADQPAPRGAPHEVGRTLYQHPKDAQNPPGEELPPWFVLWTLQDPH